METSCNGELTSGAWAYMSSSGWPCCNCHPICSGSFSQKMKAVAALIWISFVTVATSETPCEEWKKLGDYCYMRSCGYETFSDAQTSCNEENGDLTSISTEEEYLHIAGA
ncbi:hypothetical protein Y032_0006g3007 [Ancylostoma ceylanicum]|uniref:C-type lectin domain-containing protein n=2 Tax=Ancylostoma ceylanicum TaxID=53326 RepID=A0A016VR47_9BILA|nr:hypothetical protein Y032_0006g3007 [Ancylostoma ceylanicum]